MLPVRQPTRHVLLVPRRLFCRQGGSVGDQGKRGAAPGNDCCKILLNIPNASWPIVGQAWSYQEVYGDLCIAVDAPALVCPLSPLVLVPSKNRPGAGDA